MATGAETQQTARKRPSPATVNMTKEVERTAIIYNTVIHALFYVDIQMMMCTFHWHSVCIQSHVSDDCTAILHQLMLFICTEFYQPQHLVLYIYSFSFVQAQGSTLPEDHSNSIQCQFSSFQIITSMCDCGTSYILNLAYLSAYCCVFLLLSE